MMAKANVVEIGWDETFAQQVIGMIKPRDWVTIINRFGQESRGRAVMRAPAVNGWVLNMGGAHGRPGVVSAHNVVAI